MGSMFKKIAEAKMTGHGNNLRDGNYIAVVEKLVYNDKAKKGEVAIAELRILEAEPNGEEKIDKGGKSIVEGQPAVPNKANTTFSFVANLTKHDNAAENVKKFVFGVLQALGYTEDMITEELITKVYSPNSPLRGMKVKIETYRTTNKGTTVEANKGMIMVFPNWKPVKQTKEDIKAMRTYLDENKSSGSTEDDKDPSGRGGREAG
jgi:hypothetical protein